MGVVLGPGWRDPTTKEDYGEDNMMEATLTDSDLDISE